MIDLISKLGNLNKVTNNTHSLEFFEDGSGFINNAKNIPIRTFDDAQECREIINRITIDYKNKKA